MVDDSWTQQAGNGARLPLSQQEIDILTRSAHGLGVDEVAREIDLAADEVRMALTAARGKLGARSKLEAVLIAIQRGVIKP